MIRNSPTFMNITCINLSALLRAHTREFYEAKQNKWFRLSRYSSLLSFIRSAFKCVCVCVYSSAISIFIHRMMILFCDDRDWMMIVNWIEQHSDWEAATSHAHRVFSSSFSSSSSFNLIKTPHQIRSALTLHFLSFGSNMGTKCACALRGARVWSPNDIRLCWLLICFLTFAVTLSKAHSIILLLYYWLIGSVCCFVRCIWIDRQLWDCRFDHTANSLLKSNFEYNLIIFRVNQVQERCKENTLKLNAVNIM